MAALLLLGVIAGIAVLRVYFHGAALAQRIMEGVNRGIRGRLEIESAKWPLSALIRAAAGGVVPVELHGVRVYDFEGDRIVDVPVIELEVDARTALIHQDLIVEQAVIDKGWVKIKEVDEPYPMYQGDLFVASIVSAFYPKKLPDPNAPASQEPGPRFEIVHADLRHIELEFVYPAFTARVEEVKGEGSLIFDMHDPQDIKLVYDVAAAAPSGNFTSGPVELQLRDVAIAHLRQGVDPEHPDDVQWKATTTTPEGATIALEGSLVGYWRKRWKSTLEATIAASNAGPLLARLTDNTLGGTSVKLQVTTTGPRLEPTLFATVTGLDATVPISSKEPPLDLSLPQAMATLEVRDNLPGTLALLVLGGGGAVQVTGTYALEPFGFDARLEIPQAVRLGRYLSRRVADLTGTTLRGSLHAHSGEKVVNVDAIDLWLGRAHLTGALSRTEANLLQPRRFAVTIGKTRVEARGLVDLTNEELRDLELSYQSADLAEWLRRLGYPAVASSAEGHATIKGPFAAPTAEAELTVGGIPAIDRVHARVGYAGEVVNVREASGAPFGGQLKGSGKLRLGARPRLQDVTLDGAGLELARWQDLGISLSGIAHFHAEGSGPLDRPHASLTAGADDLTIAGDRYNGFSLSAQSEPDGGLGLALHLERNKGGDLEVNATVGRRGELDGVVSVRRLPIESFAGVAGPDGEPVAGGIIDAELRLSGTSQAPTADGSVTLVKSWFKEAFLGSAALDLERIDDGRMRLSGRLFQGKIRLDAEIGTRWPYPVLAHLELTRVEVDQLLPDLAARYGARGWVSGVLDAQVQLGTASASQVAVRFNEMVVLVDDDDPQGRPRPIKIRNLTPLAIVYDGKAARLLEPCTFRGPTGDFTLSGGGSAKALALNVNGAIDARLLAQYVRDYFAEPQGKIDVNVDVGGTLTAPRVTGVVNVEEVSLRPLGGDSQVSIPAGKIEVTNDQVSLTGLSMVVVDEVSGQSSELSFSGGVKMQDFKPVQYAINIDGQLAGKMLLVFLPQQFTAATGAANLSLAILGPGDRPDIEGTIEFGSDESVDKPTPPLAFIPRGLRREILLSRGTIVFTKQLVELDGIQGRIDDAGTLRDLSGQVVLDEWRPTEVDVSISADALPFSIPGALELDLNLDGVRLAGNVKDGLALTGDLIVVDGRYVRRFSPWLDVIEPERTSETETPVWQESPLLADLRLDLRLTTDAFFIKNNIADIELHGALTIGGSPARPSIDGQIRVEQGSFKFQGIRARFSRTSGNVQFSPFRTIPEETPIIDLRGESDYRDSRGQQHLIVLTIQGPIGNLSWDLWTDTGLNKSQTLALITTGRTIEENRSALGDAAIGGPADPRQGPAADPNAVYDELVKDVAGDFISLLIEDPLRNLTKLDVARIEVGVSGSVSAHGEKRFGQNLILSGDFEYALRGSTVLTRIQYRLLESLSLEGEWRRQKFSDEAEEDINRGSGKVTFRFLIP